MGWTCFEKPYDVKAYFREALNWESEQISYRALDLAIVHTRELYAAIERRSKATDEVERYAVVVLLNYHTKKGVTELCYKQMEETMGPTASNCPARILDLLDPISEEEAAQYAHKRWALEWRQRCRANIAKQKENRAKKKVGAWLVASSEDGIRVAGDAVIKYGRVAQNMYRRKLVWVLQSNAGTYRLNSYLLSKMEIGNAPEALI